MAPELSSNWKKLQATIKAEPSKPSAPKRKAPDSESSAPPSTKRQKPQHALPKSTLTKPKPHPSKKTPTPKPPPPKQMGNTQSSKVDPVLSGKGISPSLSLWASENDISPEDLAEAYNLGSSSSRHSNALLKTDQPSRPNEGLAQDILPSLSKAKYLAIDCEMVGIGEGGHDSVLARVSVVDFHGRQVYDSFVRPKERVTDWRTHVSGVGPGNMPTARTFEEVQSQVAELLKGRILVGHDVKHDLQVLMLEHSPKFIRDTAKFPGFKKYGNGRKPALRVLAQEILGVEIQTGQHSSIEDARVTMLLFRKHKNEFDLDHANRYDTAPQGRSKHTKKRR